MQAFTVLGSLEKKWYIVVCWYLWVVILAKLYVDGCLWNRGGRGRHQRPLVGHTRSTATPWLASGCGFTKWDRSLVTCRTDNNYFRVGFPGEGPGRAVWWRPLERRCGVVVVAWQRGSRPYPPHNHGRGPCRRPTHLRRRLLGASLQRSVCQVSMFSSKNVSLFESAWIRGP